MTAQELLRRIDDLGVELTLAGDRIRYRSHGRDLAPELLAEMKERRDELVELLARRAQLTWPPAPGAPAGDRTGPLTLSQRTMWATNYFVEDGTYNLCGALRLRGSLDEGVLRGVLDDLQRRHPSLRTVFPVEGGEPHQRVLAEVPVPLVTRDFGDRAPGEAFAAALEECAEVADRLLAVDEVPPVRMRLYRLAEGDHLFFVVLHHIVADGVSFQVLIDDLVRCYNAGRAGVPPPAVGHDIDMIDYALWEGEYLRYGDLGPARRYWREALRDAPQELPSLPPPAAAGPTPERGAAHQLVLDGATTAAARELAASTRSSGFLVVATAVAVTLSRITGRDDLIAGMPVARRDREGLPELVGLLLDTVPVRFDLRGDPSFAEMVARVRAGVLGALTHPFLPPEAMPGKAGTPDWSGRSLFNVLVTDAGAELPRPRFDDLEASEVEVPQVGAKFDLNFLIRDLGDALRIDVEFDRQVVGVETVRAMAETAAAIVAQAATRPGRPLSELAGPASAAAGPGTRAESAGAGADPPAPTGGSAVALLRRLFVEVLSDESGPDGNGGLDLIDDTVDFFDLGGDSMRAIRLVGLAQERGMALSLRDVYDAPVLRDMAARAVVAEVDGPVEAGARPEAAYRPFSLVPPGEGDGLPAGVEDAYPMTALQVGMMYHQELAPESRVYHNLLSVRVGGPMDQEAFRAAVQAVADRHPILRTSFDVGHAAGPMQRVHARAEVPIRFEDLTGLGGDAQARRIEEVLEDERMTDFDITAAPLLRFVILTLSPDEYQLVFSHHHILLDGWSVNILFDDLNTRYQDLLAGGAGGPGPELRGSLAEYVAQEQEALADPAEEEFWLERASRPGRMLAAPRGTEPDMRRMSFSFPGGTIAGLRRVAADTGVPLKALLLAAHVRVLSWLVGADDVVTGLVLTCRPDGPDADRLLGLFLNELPLYAHLGDPTWAELARQVHAEELVMTDHRWYPHAAILSRRGTGPLFDSYFNFTDFHTTKRMLQEGLELLDALELEYTHYALGVNFTVDLRTHELRLIFEYDAVRLDRSAVVLAAEAHRRVVAAIIDDPDAPSRRVSLPGVLDRVEIEVEDEGLPRTDPVAAEEGPAPGADPPPAATAVPAAVPAAVPGAPARPETALERSVRETWVEVLGPGEYAVDASFFTVGGDSLSAMQVVSRLRARHGAFSMRTFAAAPTIVATARALEGDSDAGPVPAAPMLRAVPGAGERRYPLTAAQYQLWLLATRLSTLPLFGIPGAFRIEGPVDIDLLDETFATLAARHEALRTRFAATAGGAEQIVAPHVDLEIEYEDLAAHPEPLAEVEALMAAAARRPFALDTAPLLRVVLYRIAPDSHVLFLNIHHIVCDGWSMALLQQEATEIYAELRTGAPAPRPHPLGSGQLAAARVKWAGSDLATAQRRHWVERLAPPWPALSSGPGSRFSSPEGLDLLERFRFHSRAQRLAPATVEAVRQAGAAHGLTEFMVVLAAYGAALSEWSGQDDVRVATMLANRGEPGAEGVIGLLANTAVLRLRAGQDGDLAELARHSQQVCLDAYDHQEVPFEHVLDSLQETYPEDERAGPLFEAMLLMQDEVTGIEVGEDVRLTPFRSARRILSTTLSPTATDLILAATSGPSGIELNLQYKPAALEDADAKELLEAVAGKVGGIARALGAGE